MNTTLITRRIKSAFFISPFILILLVLNGCEDSKPDYLSKIPDIESFNYFAINDWNSLSIKTINVNPIYKSGQDSLANIARIGFIEEINDSSIWVADVVRAEVIELNTNSKKRGSRIILRTGDGPNEIVRPSSIYHAEAKDSLIYVLDSGQACIIIVNNQGIEVKRNCIPNIPISSISVYFQVLNKGSYIWTSDIQEHFVVAEWDTTGNMIKGLVKRLIPIGYQPKTYNNVVYAINKTDSSFVYSYKGLPLIFLSKKDENYVINLLPEQRLNEFNVPLDLKPETSGISVNNMIRDIYIVGDKIFVSLLTELYVIDIERREITRRFTFTRDDGTEIKFHMFKATENRLYVVDQYHNDIYLVPINKLLD